MDAWECIVSLTLLLMEKDKVEFPNTFREALLEGEQQISRLLNHLEEMRALVTRFEKTTGVRVLDEADDLTYLKSSGYLDECLMDIKRELVRDHYRCMKEKRMDTIGEGEVVNMEAERKASMEQANRLSRTIYLLDLQSMAIRNPWKRRIQQIQIKKMLDVVANQALHYSEKKQRIVTFLKDEQRELDYLLLMDKSVVLLEYRRKVLRHFSFIIGTC
ncbi:hypothetical protein [Listeria newyorkensis]|uniref:hypothetical protein n=1 Tax=Listeria newyorkensis TaxID=1497681 RepID=UPI0011EA5E45|nr:hypothetical protein [Listeria newyorkensis]